MNESAAEEDKEGSEFPDLPLGRQLNRGKGVLIHDLFSRSLPLTSSGNPLIPQQWAKR